MRIFIHALLQLIIIAGIVLPDIAIHPQEALAAPIVEGNSVHISTPDVYIEATPATLTASGWVEVLFWTKNFDGNVDVAYGFNGLDNVVAMKSETWESYEHIKYRWKDAVKTLTYTPYKLVAHKDKTLATKVAKSDFGDDPLNPKFAEITVEEIDDKGIPKQMVLNLAYESTDGKTYTYKKTVKEQEEYRETYIDWNKKNVSSSFFTHAGANKWDIAPAKTVTRNELQKVRVWIEIPFKGKDSVTGKYNIGIKPSNLTIDQAKSQGKLWVLDPWYSASWGYRKELMCYGSNAGAQTDYQKKIRVYAADAGADMPENLAQYTTGDDAQHDITSGQYVAQTFTAEATATVKRVFLKMNKTGVPAGSPVVAIYSVHGADNHPNVAVTGTDTIIGTLISTTADWYEYEFGAGALLTSGTIYAVVATDAASVAGNCIRWYSDSTAGGAYPYGTAWASFDGGATWASIAYDNMFQVITTTTGAVPLRVDTEGHCLASFADLRFTKADKVSIIPHWIENEATCVADGYADCWIKLDTIAQMTSLTEHTHFWVYYGNSGASTTSDVTTTMVYGDNWNDASFDATKWRSVTTGAGGTYTEAGGLLTVTSGAAVGDRIGVCSVVGSVYGTGYIAIGRGKRFGVNDNAMLVGFADATTPLTLNFYSYGLRTDVAGGNYTIRTSNDAASSSETYGAIDAAYHYVAYVRQNTNAPDHGWIDDNLVYGTYYAATNRCPAVLSTLWNGALACTAISDYYAVGKYVVSQPLWGVSGAEVALTAPTVTTGLCTGTGTSWAILNGEITALATQDGTTYNSTARGFNYGLTGSYGSTYTESGDFGLGTYSGLITGLAPSTTYHYRAYTSVGAVIGYGADATFTTLGSLTCNNKYEPADDGNTSVYGINWVAQTFTTPSGMPFTAASAYIKAHKVLSPTGAVTLSIYRATGGLPVGQALTSGTFLASLLSTSDSWMGCNMATEYSLEPNTTYALVVSSPTSDSANYVVWRNLAAGGYAGGASSTSANSGTDWVAAVPDQAFRICGNPCLQVQDVKVFTAYRETDDWLVAIRYINVYPPYYDTYDVRKLFALQLVDSSGVVKATTSCPAWGNRVGSIYLSAATASPLTYGGVYRVRIYGTFTGNPYTEYAVQTTDWMGSDLTNLDSWVITSASVIGSYYSLSLTTYIAERGEVLNSTGSSIFLAGIAGLSQVRPNLFQTYTNPSNYTPGTITQTYRQSLWDWETNIGADGEIMLDRMGAVFGIDGSIISVIIFLIMFFILAALAFPAGHTNAALGLSLPMLGAAIFFGMDLVYIALMTLIAAFLFVKSFWLDKGS